MTDFSSKAEGVKCLIIMIKELDKDGMKSLPVQGCTYLLQAELKESFSYKEISASPRWPPLER